MECEYDVVVVGAGPSGLQFAREVASRSDYSVAVLERNDDLRDNDKSTGGTFPEVVEGYGLPDEVVMAEASAVAFEGPTSRSRHAMTSYVLDFPEFLAFLGQDAAAEGADIRTGTRVTDPIVENGTVRGVRYVDDDGTGGGSGDNDSVGSGDNGSAGSGGGDGGGSTSGDGDDYDSCGDAESELRARITVDASGPNAVLTSELGLFDTGTAQRGIGLEFEVEGEYDTDDALLFRFDHEFAPGGYAWTFPAGERVFKAGVCWMDEFHDARAGGGRSPGRQDANSDRARPAADSIHARVERWLDADPRWTADEVRAKHAGVGVWNDSMNRRATHGLLAVGDAISSINPLFGEGIRPGMESATMAADAALSALDAGDPSESRLREYERRWNETHGRSWKIQRIIGELLYDFDPGQQDEFIERVDRLSVDQAEQLRRYDLDALPLARLYPPRLKDVPKLPRIVSYL